MTINDKIYQMEETLQNAQYNLPDKKTFVKKAIAEYRATAVGTFNELEKGIADVKNKAKADYAKLEDEAMQNYRNQMESVQKDIFKESSCNKLPRGGKEVFDILWNEAYSRGHAHGMCAVYNEFVKLDRMCTQISKVLLSKTKTASKAKK